jgi:hypothetical protein
MGWFIISTRLGRDHAGCSLMFTASYLWTNQFVRRKVEAMKAYSFFGRPCHSTISRRAASKKPKAPGQN